MITFKTLAGTAAVAVLGSLALPAAASAGTWHLNAAACPDLRNDGYRDRSHAGYRDRRAHYYDRQTINCPVQAWHYQPDRWEDRHDIARAGAHYGTPGLVRIGRDGNFYRTGHHGRLEPIRVEIAYPYRSHYSGYRGRHHPRYGRPGYPYHGRSGASVTFTFSN